MEHAITVDIIFADGETKAFKIPCEFVVSDVLHRIGDNLGLNQLEGHKLVAEWGLTVCSGQSQHGIDVEWLEPMHKMSKCPLKLLFGKRLFPRRDDLQILNNSPFLRKLLYYQLLQSYLHGHIYCPAYEATKMSALAAYVNVASNVYLTSGTVWLEEFVPPRLKTIPYITQAVSKHMRRIGHRSEMIVQTAFIKGIISLETFGYNLYTAQMENVNGVFGIKESGMVLMDENTLEHISYWKYPDLLQCNVIDEHQICFSFQHDNVYVNSQNVNRIKQQISQAIVYNQTSTVDSFDTYILHTGDTTDDESQDEEMIINTGIVHTTASGDDYTDDCSPPVSKSSKSPIARNGESRRAFRKQKSKKTVPIDPKQTRNLDSVKELSELMKTDFKTDARWTNRDSNPIYDVIASARIDVTLKRNNITFSSLSETLSSAPPLPTSAPPPLPSTTSNERATQEEDPPAEYSQRLGAYPLVNIISEPTNRSRLLLPGEVLKDYATLKREFRMFCVKLPNGVIHWELASLYQPIKKLIARLCVIIHLDQPEQYQLTVEGSLADDILKRRDIFDRSDDSNLSSREYTPSPLSKRKVSSSEKDNYQSQGLDSNQTFCEQGIASSRILLLSSIIPTTDSITVVPIRLPSWVKFRQCWLSVVQGNHPCSVDEAITLAAILYQCYVLDRTEVNSVISFCSVNGFLPPKYTLIRSIENRILQERERLLSSTRSELEQLYIEGVTSSPNYNYTFFPCKEPKRQFLASNKMVPILIGIGKDGIVRVNYKTKEVIDIWGYETLKNWGFTQYSFMLAFESSTYPVKCSQGKWMAELVSFHVQSIVKQKGLLKEPTTPSASTKANVHPAYFSLMSSEEPSVGAIRESKYFILEKVYDDLVEAKSAKQPTTSTDKLANRPPQYESLYVNPLPNCSLINPDDKMMARFHKLGITNKNQCLYNQMPNEEEALYDEVPNEDDDEALYDEVPFEDELNYATSDEGITETTSDDDDNNDDDAIYFRLSDSLINTKPEHLYDIPPDAT